MRVVNWRALAKERGLRGCPKLRKVKLITFLQNNLQPEPSPGPCPRHPTRPPLPSPPTPQHPQLVGFRPDRPRQPQLLRQLEERYPRSVRPRQLQHSQLVRSIPTPTFKQNQLKPKRNKETFKETCCGSASSFKPKTDQMYEEKVS